MVFGIITDVVNILRSAVDWFIQTVPTPLRIIIFLFILVFVGNGISSYFLEDKYMCLADYSDGNKTQLVDASVFFQCGDYMESAWLAKHNATQEIETLLGTQVDLSAVEGNSSLQALLLLSAKEGTKSFFELAANPATRYRAEMNIFQSFLIWNENKSFSNFMDVFFGDPRDQSCTRLSYCLPDDERGALGLSASCSVEEVPEWDDYIRVTRPNVTRDNVLSFTGTVASADEGVSGSFNPFFVGCSAYKGDSGSQPRITFLGFDFLNPQLWIILFVLGGIFIYGFRFWRVSGIMK